MAMHPIMKEALEPFAPKSGEWRYSINYGPEGEANYANVYDDHGDFVSNLKTHHAVAVVNAMNTAPEMLDALVAIKSDETIRSVMNSPLWHKLTSVIEKAEGRS